MPACAAKSVGLGVSAIPPLLQTAKTDCKKNLFILREEASLGILHYAGMSEKNAGPNFLRAWREHRKLTQEALAEKVGTTGAVISLLEDGQRGLSAKWLRKLAPALDTTPGHLLDHDPNDLPADVLDIWKSIADREKPRALRALEIFKTGTND